MRGERKEVPVNLVRREGDDTYRIVDDREMFSLKANGRVIFEKSRVDKGRVGSFYIEVA